MEIEYTGMRWEANAAEWVVQISEEVLQPTTIGRTDSEREEMSMLVTI